MLIDQIDEWHANPDKLRGLPTGFDEFDKKTGGLRPGDLVIVAGRPSMGKTTFAVNMAEYAALKSDVKASVAIFSMEMPSEQLMTRMLSSIGRVQLGHIRSGQISDEDWPRITGAAGQLSEARIFIDETPGLSPTELRARARRVSREHGLDLVVVDYLQLMQVPGNKENRATEIAEISRGLKALAKELKVPVIALSQLNRGVEQRTDKKPVMSDLRESGAIEQDADMILLIYREEVYDKNTTKRGMAEIDLAKHRNGETGTFVLTFQGQYRASSTTRPTPTPRACCADAAVSRILRACIDRGALRSNLDAVRAAAPGARVMAVVKANAYGHGLVAVASGPAGADALAPTRSRAIEEGVLLREAGITQPIVLLEGVFSGSQLAEAAHRDFELVVHDPSQIALLEAFGRGRRFTLWIKIDTGMNRLGFRPEEFPAALSRLHALPVPPREIRLLTHLARADERDCDMTADAAGAPACSASSTRCRPRLVRRFRRASGRQHRQLGGPARLAGGARRLGAARSRALRRFAVPGTGRRRPRAGSGDDAGEQRHRGPSRAARRDRRLRRRTWRAERESTIAILAAGYGDGVPRHLASGAPVRRLAAGLTGRAGELAGRVSMDMIAVDVTGLPPVVGSATVPCSGARPCRSSTSPPTRRHHSLRADLRRQPARCRWSCAERQPVRPGRIPSSRRRAGSRRCRAGGGPGNRWRCR